MKANSDFVLGNRRVACLGHVILAAFSGWQHVLFLPDSHSFAFFWVSSPLSSSLPTITRIQTQLNHPECVCVCGGVMMSNLAGHTFLRPCLFPVGWMCAQGSCPSLGNIVPVPVSVVRRHCRQAGWSTLRGLRTTSYTAPQQMQIPHKHLEPEQMLLPGTCRHTAGMPGIFHPPG